MRREHYWLRFLVVCFIRAARYVGEFRELREELAAVPAGERFG